MAAFNVMLLQTCGEFMKRRPAHCDYQNRNALYASLNRALRKLYAAALLAENAGEERRD